MNQTTTADLSSSINRGKQKSFSEYFKEMVYGGVDGIVTTFAVVSGFSGAALSSDLTTQLSFVLVLLFGLANLFADAISMGLGNFLSVRSEKDQYQIMRDKEKALLQSDPTTERKETVEIMLAKGFSAEDANTLADIYSKNEDYWLDFMMANEHEMSDPRGDNPVLTGLITFGSFLVFGAVPILPFVFLGDVSATLVFQVSAVGTFLALVLLGLLKWKMVGTGIVRSLMEVVLVGSVAATIAFFVGTFFKI
ncbi:MAG: VIT1/CCC1 transporter family protein [Candidatus Paceibacterota bacterium]